ncbi:hypothetical protein [Mumia sp. DW29H23]|uniref:hypothetical protein n=1 Tax=Mumia sp. DW29H23 TaxID=3421241 RepID=UPI003D681BA5
MEQAGPHRDGVGGRPRRRSWDVVLTTLLVIGTVVGVALFVVRPWSDDDEPLPSLRPGTSPDQVRSLSIDFGIVTDPETDWGAVSRNLAAAHATTVNLNAGRVEFTAFDWPEHPEAAADEGVDHLAAAVRTLHESPDGDPRQVNLIVDAFVPRWIEEDPSIAGVAADGTRSEYTASATQLAEGEVGDRLVAYVEALGERYDPTAIEVTELFLNDYSFGDDDLALFREMTGADDWPRTSTGAIDTTAPEIGQWRSEVVAGLLNRMRAALDGVDGDGGEIGLVLDVRVDWEDPAAGQPGSGQDYQVLLDSVRDLRLQLWAYVGRPVRPATDVERLTAALRDAGYDMARFVISVGLWGDGPADDAGTISPAALDGAVRSAATNGITDVNVTPYSLMTDAHWEVLRTAWSDAAPTSTSPAESPPASD